MQFGEFELDRAGRQLLHDGRPVRLSPKALALLELLLERRPAAVSKAEIRDQVWPRTFVADSNLIGLVTELRKALGDEARRPRLPRTVYGLGYAFCGEAVEPARRPRCRPRSGGRERGPRTGAGPRGGGGLRLEPDRGHRHPPAKIQRGRPGPAGVGERPE